MPEILALAEQKKIIDPYNMALLYAAGREPEKALAWLSKPGSMAVSSPGMLQYDPQLDPIRSDSRFEGFLEKHKQLMSQK